MLVHEAADIKVRKLLNEVVTVHPENAIFVISGLILQLTLESLVPVCRRV